MHDTCFSGNVELVKFLVETGRFDILATDKEKQTLLHESFDNLQLIQYLISLNALAVNEIDNNGNTVFLKAVNDESANVIEYLISNPTVNITIHNKNGKNVLHLLIENDNLQLLKLLVNLSKIPLNQIDKSRNTHLHYACRNRNLKIIFFKLKNHFLYPTPIIMDSILSGIRPIPIIISSFFPVFLFPLFLISTYKVMASSMWSDTTMIFFWKIYVFFSNDSLKFLYKFFIKN